MSLPGGHVLSGSLCLEQPFPASLLTGTALTPLSLGSHSVCFHCLTGHVHPEGTSGSTWSLSLPFPAAPQGPVPSDHHLGKQVPICFPTSLPGDEKTGSERTETHHEHGRSPVRRQLEGPQVTVASLEQSEAIGRGRHWGPWTGSQAMTGQVQTFHVSTVPGSIPGSCLPVIQAR